MKMEIWSTLPVWDTSYYMESQPAHILVLIHDWGFIPEYNWYSGDTFLSLDDPSALAQEWSNFKCNKIYEVQKDLDRDFHLYGYTDRIAVYGPKGDRYDPYPGLLINTEIEDPVICDPLWLSEMLEAGFISKLVITSAIQISLFPKVIKEAAAQIGGLNYMKMEIWSTLPVWDTSHYMESQPAHILVLIHDWGFIPEYNWYSGDTFLSLDDPSALTQEWSNFKCNKIYEVQKDLDKDFHLYGYTDRIAVYGPRPSARRLIGKRRIGKDPRLMIAKDHVPVFILISYCALCNDYGVSHEHEQYEDNTDPIDYDNYVDTD
nr:hypothetical protein CFP56_52995 [Quercus suber]